MPNELSHVIDALPGLVWTARPDGRVDFFNQRWFEYTGVILDGSGDWDWHTVVHPEDLPQLCERWRSIVDSGQPGEIEARLRRFDREYHWFLMRACPVTDASGSVVKWCGINTDIEHERQGDQARHGRWWLSRSGRECQFREIGDMLRALFVLATPAGEIEMSNRQVLEYFAAAPEQMKGRLVSQTVHPDDLPHFEEAWTRAVETGAPFVVEARHRRSDGIYRWFNVRGLPLRDTQGHIVFWYLLQADIDERKNAEALLAAENRLLEMVASGHPLDVVLDALCRVVEQTSSDCRCTISLVDASGTHLQQGAAPSIPLSFSHSAHAGPINVDSNPCAMAVSLKTQVIVSDAVSDLRWEAQGWRALALTHGLRSCWCTPISSAKGNLLGTLALYRYEPGTPTPLHQSLMQQFTHIASIAIEHAQSDASLKQSEARKAAILESALDCIVTIDQEGCITEFNPAAERAFGYRRDEVIRKQLADAIIPARLREQHRQALARYLETGEARVIGTRVEMVAVRRDGSEFPVELAITRIPLDGPPSFTGYLRDITERKQSIEQLKRSEAFLAEAQHLSHTGSFGWRMATKELVWSDEVYRIYGLDPAVPITSKLICSRIHPEDLPFMREQAARARGGGALDFDYEHRLQMPDGSIKYLHTVARATRNQDGSLEYVGAVQDVTERRVSEQALGKLRSELAHVARVTTVGALTASIAHEVNQPLAGIITNASTCLRMLAADPPNLEGARETARRTIRDGHRASDVITRLRALFAKKAATRECVDLNEAIREVIALARSELQRRRVLLRTELAEDLPAVTGDRVQLQQVILNLLRNALDAMSAVEDRPRQLVVRTERDEDDCVRVSVQDAGVGFEARDASRLFDAFYTTKATGMGIGLSVSRSIIEHHGGRVWAVPNEGPGATFAFSVPLGDGGKTGDESRGRAATAAVKDAAPLVRNS